MSHTTPAAKQPADQPEAATNQSNPLPEEPATAPEGGWTDGQKWWADLTKNLVTFVLVSLIGLTVFNRCENERARVEANRRLHYGYLLSAVKDFQAASALYSSQTYDVFRTNFYGAELAGTTPNARKKEWTAKTEPQFLKWNEAFDQLKVARISVQGWASANQSLANIGDIKAQLSAFEALLKEIDLANDKLWERAGRGDPRAGDGDAQAQRSAWEMYMSTKKPRGDFGKLRVRYADAAARLVATLLKTEFVAGSGE